MFFAPKSFIWLPWINRRKFCNISEITAVCYYLPWGYIYNRLGKMVAFPSLWNYKTKYEVHVKVISSCNLSILWVHNFLFYTVIYFGIPLLNPVPCHITSAFTLRNVEPFFHIILGLQYSNFSWISATFSFLVSYPATTVPLSLFGHVLPLHSVSPCWTLGFPIR